MQGEYTNDLLISQSAHGCLSVLLGQFLPHLAAPLQFTIRTLSFRCSEVLTMKPVKVPVLIEYRKIPPRYRGLLER
jgi:hypothetical protein